MTVLVRECSIVSFQSFSAWTPQLGRSNCFSDGPPRRLSEDPVHPLMPNQVPVCIANGYADFSILGRHDHPNQRTNYLAVLNVLVDELGGAVDLIGRGWMALIYAARFPAKVRRLVLAGAPIDMAAGRSKLSDLADNTPMSIFHELVELGDGRVLGHRAR